ncbi:hypothetical protein ONZ45_g18046 [Pleurotus djamor]|nr:hypothetical protein ONZ45_g18046 [Pleurotus djamor]
MAFSTSIRSALVIVTFAALTTAAASLKVSGPDAVKGVDNLHIVTTLVNTGDETLKLLNEPLSDVHAFVDPSQADIVTLCGAFWRAPLTGTDSQGGTIIHEASHFIVNGATQDHAYGQANAQFLARIDPSRAVDNADSHEYFAENNLALS